MVNDSVEIQPGLLEDIPALQGIEQSAGQRFLSYPGLEWIADDSVMSREAHKRAIDSGLSFTAVTYPAGGTQPKTVGFICAELVGDQMHILELSVAMASQGKGIGKALVNYLIDKARALGLIAMTLTTFREVAWNEPFYQHLGFFTVDDKEIMLMTENEHLHKALQDEAKQGLVRSQRCAMRLPLARSQPGS